MEHPDQRSFARQMQGIGDAVAMTARLTRDLPAFLRRPLTPEQARARVLHRLANRERRLLGTIERAIYRRPGSPYLRLLQHVGCEPGDLRVLVAHEGIEGALGILARQGVYIAPEELKGRREIVRGSLRFTVREDDFNNPLVRPHLVRFTGGSGGRPTRVPYSLAFIEEWGCSLAVALEAHGIREAGFVSWWGVPFTHLVMFPRIGRTSVGWFYPVHPLPRIVPIAARYLCLLGSLAGASLPLPRRSDLADPEPIVRWITNRLAGEALILWATPSAGVRLSVAARDLGRSLHGLTMIVGGEPITPARQRTMADSGARLLSRYGSVELGGVANDCATPSDADDMHVYTERWAAVQLRRPTVEGGPLVDSLLLTSLSPAAPKIALNVEPGDYAQLQERDCGCQMGALGLRTHISQIRSFEKLTGEGVTFARSSIEQVLEELLPARFGGTSLDYQIAEEEAESSATRLVLRVSPSAGQIDEARLRAFFLDAIGRADQVNDYQARIWRNAGSLLIRREPPLATRAGKVLPLHLLRRPEGAAPL